jgi:hypothetical protein
MQSSLSTEGSEPEETLLLLITLQISASHHDGDNGAVEAVEKPGD